MSNRPNLQAGSLEPVAGVAESCTTLDSPVGHKINIPNSCMMVLEKLLECARAGRVLWHSTYSPG